MPVTNGRRAIKKYYYDSFLSYSAGVKKTSVHPFAVKVMAEIGIDISDQYSRTVDEFEGELFDIVVTVCDHARETCPYFPGEKIIHQSFADPSLIQGTIEERLKVFRKIRDDIHKWVDRTFQSPIDIGMHQ